MPYYAVIRGYTPGIYTDWRKVELQVKGFASAKYKKFNTLGEAEYYYETGRPYNSIGKVKIKSDGNIMELKKKPNRETVSVWTDGSAINNGKKSCKAGYGVYFNKEKTLKGKIKENPSNQRAELMAIWFALQEIPRDKAVIVYTDSDYSIKCISQWSYKWKNNGWKTSDGKDVKHKELIRDIHSLYETMEVKFIHVRSHKSPPSDKLSEEYRIWYGNYMADNLANEAVGVKSKDSLVNN